MQLTWIRRHVQSLLVLRLFPPIQIDSSHSSGRRTATDSGYEQHSLHEEKLTMPGEEDIWSNQCESVGDAQDLKVNEKQTISVISSLLRLMKETKSIIGHFLSGVSIPFRYAARHIWGWNCYSGLGWVSWGSERRRELIHQDGKEGRGWSRSRSRKRTKRTRPSRELGMLIIKLIIII